MSADRGSGGLRSGLNVTPLVDIVLVLLIIFLVTMPIQLQQLSVEVPRELDEVASQQVVVTLAGDGTVAIRDGTNDISVDRVDLARTLRPIIESRRTEKAVFVDFDDDIYYGDAVSVMDTVRGAGATTVAIKLREATPTPL